MQKTISLQSQNYFIMPIWIQMGTAYVVSMLVYQIGLLIAGDGMIGIVLAVAIIIASTAILTIRLTRFIRTKGQSSCDSCSYSGGCLGCGAHNKS